MHCLTLKNDLSAFQEILNDDELELSRILVSAEADQLLKKTSLRSYPSGTLIYMPEKFDSRQMYILKEGRVNLYRLTSSGRRFLIGKMLPGTVFNFRGLFGRNIIGIFAEAAEDSLIYVMKREEVLKYLTQNPRILLHILEIMCTSLCHCEERLTEMIYNSVKMRVANYLLLHSDPNSGLLYNFSHEDIGNAIGAARQTVTEALGNMRRQGLIVVRQREIQIIDWEAIEQMVNTYEK